MPFSSLIREPGSLAPNDISGLLLLASVCTKRQWSNLRQPELIPQSITDQACLLSSYVPSPITLQHTNAMTLANQVTPTCGIAKQMSSYMQENRPSYSQGDNSTTKISIGNILNVNATSDWRSSNSGYSEEPSSLSTSMSSSDLADEQSIDLSLRGNTPAKSAHFSCRYCGKEFKVRRLLNKHKATHTLPFECQVCGKRFSQIQRRDDHHRRHTGEKPYACPICGLQYASKPALSYHKAKHALRFECQVCDKRFATHQLREIHHKKHTGEKPYACPICGRRYSQLSNANRHQQVHQK